VRVYRGRPPHTVVVVDPQPGEQIPIERPLPLRLDLRNHSPTGFSWGYGGSGPSQLALALLAHVCGDEIARAHYQQFKLDVIARLPGEQPWELTEEHIWDAAMPRTAGL
jgi:uncharacterized protein DUF6166